MKVKAKSAIKPLLILCIIILAYITSFQLNAFDRDFYKAEFKKYDVYEKFPEKDIDDVNLGILLFIKGKKERLDDDLFTRSEMAHLDDVRGLVQGISIAYYFSWIIAISLVSALFLLNRKGFLKSIGFCLFFSGLSILPIAAFLLAMIKLNFSGIFTVFHNIFFPQGGWMFSSSSSLINLYPSGLFYDAAKRIFLSIILYGNILILVGYLQFSKK
ncbi:DUF1461 domain-containing protein [Candidatus Woesearchaeota archaeon]|nr:DUF1461 domain-containing protein [Candidatus Woesearchaeota archaeon]